MTEETIAAGAEAGQAFETFFDDLIGGSIAQTHVAGGTKAFAGNDGDFFSIK